jgi:hypothetical protein
MNNNNYTYINFIETDKKKLEYIKKGDNLNFLYYILSIKNTIVTYIIKDIQLWSSIIIYNQYFLQHNIYKYIEC